MTLLEEYRAAVKHFNELVKARDYDASNLYRHTVIELFNRFENPFQAGDKVEHFNGNRWLPTTITEVVDNSRIITPHLIAPLNYFRYPGELPPMVEGQMELDL